MAKAYSTYLRVKFFHDRMMAIYQEMDVVVDELKDFRSRALDVLWDSARFLRSQESALKPKLALRSRKKAAVIPFPKKCIRRVRVKPKKDSSVVIHVDFSRRLF